MKIEFPSRDFDDAVASVCHGTASGEQSKALNELLRQDAAAQDEYIIRLELHSRLASEASLFSSAGPRLDTGLIQPNEFAVGSWDRRRNTAKLWTIALAASLALLAAGWWGVRQFQPTEQRLTTSKAVAMLNRIADAQWYSGAEIPRLGAPLEPGRLRLEGGLAEVIFYSGARLVLEGPAEIQLISQNNARCGHGRIVAEVPEQACGFQIETPQTIVTDMGTSFGLDVKDQLTEVHVFKGHLKLAARAAAPEQILQEGSGARMESAHAPRLIAANLASFASLFDLEARSAAADARRHNQWRTDCKHLERDPSLVAHFDFENVAPSGWQLRNLGKTPPELSNATIVGCQWTEGRWPEKRALEFQSVSDRVRLAVPGEFQALTLTAWVCVKGLDRKINSLFMSDGFEAGTIHWVIRRDGALGITVIGRNPVDHQIMASPPAVTLDKFGTWLHLAVTLDSATKRVIHYVNGLPVNEKTLKIAPPFRIGPAELGNWNAKGFPKNDPFMIRNFSGAMDELCVFNRALDASEIHALYSQGKPQQEPVARNFQ